MQDMVLKGCRRCLGDLWLEVDIVTRLNDLVCVQCGHRQAAVGAPAYPVPEVQTDGRRRQAQKRSRTAA